MSGIERPDKLGIFITARWVAWADQMETENEGLKKQLAEIEDHCDPYDSNHYADIHEISVRHLKTQDDGET